MRSPEEVRGLLGARYRRNLVTWLAEGEPGRDAAGRHEPKPGEAGRDTSGRDEPGGDGPVGSASDSVVPRPGSAERGQWPVSLPLHPPTGRQVLADPAEVAHWIRTWAQADSPRLPWRVRWEERHWRGYGRQSVPVRVEVDDAPGVARLAGQLADWEMLSTRTSRIAARWGSVAETRGSQQICARQVAAVAVGRVLQAVRHCDEADFDRALRVVDWLLANPGSGMMLRQVPVEGMDTKWLERHQGLIGALLEAARRMRGLPGGTETGLRREAKPLDGPRSRPAAEAPGCSGVGSDPPPQG